MLRHLFPRLTADTDRGAELFAAITVKARASHWYVEGQVSDSLDGRFAMLATIAAMVLVRLEQEGDEGLEIAVALTERFVHVMESEHRELGLGDPKLGRTVRKLVGVLARRTDIWRDAVGTGGWDRAVRDSLYGGVAPSEAARAHVVTQLSAHWSRLSSAPIGAIADGRLE